MDIYDPVGRRKFAPLGHKIFALVVCRGVPLRIAHDPALAADALPFTRRGEFRTNQGGVDSELSLIAAGTPAINAFIPNPLFQNAAPNDHELSQIVRVSRLDAPSFEAANALVDLAVRAEQSGLLGRAYVDIGGAHPVGDSWLETVAGQLDKLGFDLTVDREPTTFSSTARMDAPVLYFGWYAGNLNGPFTPTAFCFPPGALAFHIHSYSALTLRSINQGWVGPLLARGATATVGNVYEPYLELSHHPQLFLRALARGATLVEAAYFALPAVSWQPVLIGDPLYRPFAVSLETQLENPAALPPRLAGYAALRRMRQLEAAGRTADALAYGSTAQRQSPNLALGLGLAQRYLSAGDDLAATQALGFAPLLRSFQPDEWGLAAAAAELLAATRRPVPAVEIYATILASRDLPPETRLAWLPRALAVARIANNDARVVEWTKALATLASPEK
jgi:uncharacterized protein (TIGR03790 family)